MSTKSAIVKKENSRRVSALLPGYLRCYASNQADELSRQSNSGDDSRMKKFLVDSKAAFEWLRSIADKIHYSK